MLLCYFNHYLKFWRHSTNDYTTLAEFRIKRFQEILCYFRKLVNFSKSVLDNKEVNLTSKSIIKCKSSANTFFLPEIWSIWLQSLAYICTELNSIQEGFMAWVLDSTRTTILTTCLYKSNKNLQICQNKIII